jgi:hypothetical protein
MSQQRTKVPRSDSLGHLERLALLGRPSVGREMQQQSPHLAPICQRWDDLVDALDAVAIFSRAANETPPSTLLHG